METLRTIGSYPGLGLVVIIVICFAYLVPFLISIRPRRPKEPGFRYVCIDDDGNARELDEKEKEYLNTEFQGGDGDRPFIKSNYASKTPDWKMGGYLLRRRLPRRILINSVADERQAHHPKVLGNRHCN